MKELEELENTILQRLDDFKKSDFKDKSVVEVKKELSEFYNFYHNTVANLGNYPIFRVRKINSSEHHLISDIWCPDSSLVTNLGRANDIGESMFYGALDYQTAIEEKNISSANQYSLACFMIQPMDQDNMTSIVIKESPWLSAKPNTIEILCKKLNEFMVDEFTKIVPEGEEHKYAISCALAHTLLQDQRKDSLIYPSVKNKDSINIVIREENAKKRLVLQSVLTCECINQNQHVVINVKEADDAGNLIIKHDYESSKIPLKINSPRYTFSQLFG